MDDGWREGRAGEREVGRDPCVHGELILKIIIILLIIFLGFIKSKPANGGTEGLRGGGMEGGR